MSALLDKANEIFASLDAGHRASLIDDLLYEVDELIEACHDQAYAEHAGNFIQTVENARNAVEGLRNLLNMASEP